MGRMYSRSGVADASAKNVIIAGGQSCPAPLRPDSLNLRGAFHRLLQGSRRHVILDLPLSYIRPGLGRYIG